MNRTAKFTALYAKVPTVRCKGLCQENCSVVTCSTWELNRLKEVGTMQEELDDPLRCPFLDTEGKCSGYEARPLICRMYGAGEGLECPHGCTVEGEILSKKDGFALISEAREIGGRSVPVNRVEDLDSFLAYAKTELASKDLPKLSTVLFDQTRDTT